MPKPPKEQRVKDLWTGSTSSFKTSTGDMIGFRSWLPDGPPRKLIFIVHGLHEHCGRYAPVAELFVNSGCAVYAHDHIGRLCTKFWYRGIPRSVYTEYRPSSTAARYWPVCYTCSVLVPTMPSIPTELTYLIPT
jgi:Serine aminopeptidase, S33